MGLPPPRPLPAGTIAHTRLPAWLQASVPPSLSPTTLGTSRTPFSSKKPKALLQGRRLGSDLEDPGRQSPDSLVGVGKRNPPCSLHLFMEFD